MEGIPVKISEKYKPPRRIALPASVQNKLNTVIQFEKYDFGLERFVLEQMAKLKEQQKLMDAKPVPSSNSEEKTISLNQNKIENILTPVPLKPHIGSVSNPQQVIGGFNISDFENDTSSPFDSVELKTINEMEVLAHVLGGTSVNTTENWATNENGSNTQNWAWGYGSPSYPLHPTQHSTSIENESPGKKNSENEDNTISIIMKNLKKRIEETSLDPRKLTNSGLSIAAGGTEDNKIDKKKETLANPFQNLTPACQAVAERIAEMGFPLSRAARATEIFGPNEAKVIEFMLEVQSLEETGYPGDRVERALVACEFSRDNALRFLERTSQIMKLGFSEEEVISALIKSEFDRDKALDSLIS
ncbi:ubiquitin-associated protein 1 [Halyomorpha halys]|uniref:ubiquitin-associated protein 1 n=1 Tax=Halyomorpha halys TaxID=286706 RepID=UPI0006D4CF9E|nr:uncharacterized protein LOC106682713 [Halyomorpha halys]